MIAAERRDVYSYAITSYHLRKERNACHFALSGRGRPGSFYKHYVPTARSSDYFCGKAVLVLLREPPPPSVRS